MFSLQFTGDLEQLLAIVLQVGCYSDKGSRELVAVIDEHTGFVLVERLPGGAGRSRKWLFQIRRSPR